MTDERREKPRAEADVPCTVRTADGHDLAVQLIDLNCIGGGFVHGAALPLHSVVQLRFSLPIHRLWHEFHVTGRVIHNYNAIVIEGQHRTTGYVVGVDFMALGTADEAALCSYIEALIGGHRNADQP